MRDFRGTFRGKGPERTVLRALPDLLVSENTEDFFREEPFGTTLPWPYLVQFIEGKARDRGPRDPGPGTFARLHADDGLDLLDDGPIFELRGALLLTGRKPVDFEVRDVRVEAGDPESDLGTTTFHGVEFGGLLYDSAADGPGTFPVFPVRGALPRHRQRVSTAC